MPRAEPLKKKKGQPLDDVFYDHYTEVVRAYGLLEKEHEEAVENYKKLNREMMDLKEEFRRAQVGFVEDGTLMVLGAVCLLFGLYASWNLYGLYK